MNRRRERSPKKRKVNLGRTSILPYQFIINGAQDATWLNQAEFAFAIGYTASSSSSGAIVSRSESIEIKSLPMKSIAHETDFELLTFSDLADYSNLVFPLSSIVTLFIFLKCNGMHEESSSRCKTDEDVQEGAVPAYLLDRENTSRAEVCFLFQS
ncbi:hypothetical protein DY000_02034151 [Brassica cretica]|uniref:Uncharacterized protein n=1 Tax=Brassica cretica TaxID=69181 RepID=A0ABQ7DTN3_BRACR|nr:hypothetical protein DY000_02034151 [Brassica cretica]